jgi:hypothetical protein
MSNLQTQNNSHVERMAWGVLIVAFMTLCSLCVGSTVLAYGFSFLSTVPMEVVVQVSRGTAVVSNADLNEQALRTNAVFPGRIATLSMDSQSQANVAFREPNASMEEWNKHTLIASFTLKTSSEVRVQQAEMPRFTWTQANYHIIMRDFVGEMDVFVTNTSNKQFLMEIFTTTGNRIAINEVGRYSISVNESRVRLITYEGEAILFNNVQSQNNSQTQNRIIPTGFEGVAFTQMNTPTTSPMRQNLLENGLFIFNTNLNQTDPTAMPVRWGCSSTQDASPRGVYQVDNWGGLNSLRLFRDDNASSHGETRCLQPIDPVLRDIRDYSFMELETTFLINYQSLSDCGIQGSECPLMLLIAYTDVNGNKQEWRQGFYYASDSVLGYPPRFLGGNDHLQINEQVWYTFESGNLFNLIPSTIRPAQIDSVEFYASGHQYDIFVSEMSLFVGYVDVIPEVNGTN